MLNHARPGGASPPARMASPAAPLALIAAILVIPFMHLGASYYVSGGGLCFVLMMTASYRSVLRGMGVNRFGLVCVPLFYICLIGATAYYFTADFLRVSREALFFLITTSAMLGLAYEQPDRQIATVLKLCTIVVIGLLALVCIQFYYIPRMRFIQLPFEWFVVNDGTLPDYLSLIYTHVRPTATFGEPSYLAFIMLSFITMFSPMLLIEKRVQIFTALCLVTGVLSQSLTFVLTSLLVLGLVVIKPQRTMTAAAARKIIVLVAVAGLVVSLVVFGVSSRLGQIGAGGSDMSANTRIWVPLLALPSYLFDYPSGLPWNEMLQSLPRYTLDPNSVDGLALDNALTSTIFLYGLFGFVILAAFFGSTRNAVMLAFLFCAANFNGALFAIDKTAVFMLVALVHRRASDWAAARETALLQQTGDPPVGHAAVPA